MKERKKTDDFDIDIKEVVVLIVRNIVIIALVFCTCTLLSYLYSKRNSVEVYRSTTKIYILSKQDDGAVTYSDFQLGSQLIKDYKELIKARPVMEEVIQELNLNYSYQGLASMISIGTLSDTRIITINVTNQNPILAMNISNAVRESAAKRIKSVMEIEAVNVVEEANLPLYKYSTDVKKSALAGGLAGAFLVISIIVVRYLLDDTIKKAEDVEKKLGLSVLASIPCNDSSIKRKKRKSKGKDKPCEED